MEPIFFASPAEWRAWLETNHAEASEVIVGFHKKATGRASMTWPEAVDEALCFGWIDGVRRSHGPEAYTNRFTPRRPRSNWSAINVKRVGELTAEGRMTPAGLAAFEARTGEQTASYSYEQRQAALEPEQEARFRAAHEAWEWFSARPPSYRRAAIHWVTSAKRPETRERRLATLIDDSAAGRPVKPLARP
ncbi:MAG TPA: YdeI/OmpD-associated family protein [Solirubrobacteraceae bacterium]|nr:YdeI/OmpD-associated family protein [Solirubrobacteraceae bacterium]